jgi:hypothetical protein
MAADPYAYVHSSGTQRVEGLSRSFGSAAAAKIIAAATPEPIEARRVFSLLLCEPATSGGRRNKATRHEFLNAGEVACIAMSIYLISKNRRNALKRQMMSLMNWCDGS